MIDVPEDFELIAFFEKEPIERIPEDGLHIYKCTDQREITLTLSFNELEKSVQVVLAVQSNDIAVFSQEGAKKLSIENDNSGCYLRFLFDLNDGHTEATIQIHPYISVKWATLID